VSVTGRISKSGEFCGAAWAFSSKCESHLGQTIVSRKFLARARKAAEDGGVKTIPKTRPSNVTLFVLEGCWALDGLDHSVAKGRAVFALYGLGFAAIALEIALLYWRAWQLRAPLRLNNAEQFMTRGAIVGWCIPANVGLVSCILALTLPRDQINWCGWAYFSMFFLLPAYRSLRRCRFARLEATWAR
jgi:hypothetical protein